MSYRNRKYLTKSISVAVGASHGNRISPSAASAGPLSAQQDVVRIHNLPIGRGVAVSRAVHGLIAGYAEPAFDRRSRVAIVAYVVVNGYRHHLMVRRPQPGWIRR